MFVSIAQQIAPRYCNLCILAHLDPEYLRAPLYQSAGKYESLKYDDSFLEFQFSLTTPKCVLNSTFNEPSH